MATVVVVVVVVVARAPRARARAHEQQPPRRVRPPAERNGVAVERALTLRLALGRGERAGA
jgi:hypothetical protein